MPRLSRMGGADWERTRSRCATVAAVAEEVVALHRARPRLWSRLHEGHAVAARDGGAAFPFEETTDQAAAISSTSRQTWSLTPRWIASCSATSGSARRKWQCGRRSRRCRMVARLRYWCRRPCSPMQHHQVFSGRFAPYPIRVEALSRFLTAAEQKAVVRGIADGTVDVVIGTHRLLSEDVAFKDLGLLVVDEEQRFGVGDKDRIKALRKSVDVLTLTATPIRAPWRWLSPGSAACLASRRRRRTATRSSPLSVRTRTARCRRRSEGRCCEGQVFYVHNRIESIDHAVARLKALVPEARYAVAHGRMSEGQLGR